MADGVVVSATPVSFVDLVFAALPFELFNALFELPDPVLPRTVLLAAVAPVVAGLSPAVLAAPSLVATRSVEASSAVVVGEPPTSPAAIEVRRLMSFLSSSVALIVLPPAPAVLSEVEKAVLKSEVGGVGPVAPVNDVNAVPNADAPTDFPNTAVKADSKVCADVSPPIVVAAVAAFPPVNALDAAVSWAIVSSPTVAGALLADFSIASKLDALVCALVGAPPVIADVSDFSNAARLTASVGLVVSDVNPARLAELWLVKSAAVIYGFLYKNCSSRHRSTDTVLR